MMVQKEENMTGIVCKDRLKKVLPSPTNHAYPFPQLNYTPGMHLQPKPSVYHVNVYGPRNHTPSPGLKISPKKHLT